MEKEIVQIEIGPRKGHRKIIPYDMKISRQVFNGLEINTT